MEPNEKRAKRPRINQGISPIVESNRESATFSHPQRPYQPRYNDNAMNSNGYQPRANNNDTQYYQNNDRAYTPRENRNYNSDYQGQRQYNRFRQPSGNQNYEQGYNRGGYNRNQSGYGQNRYNDNRNFNHESPAGANENYHTYNNQHSYNNRRSFNNRNNYRSDSFNNGNTNERNFRNNFGTGKKFVPRPKPVQYEMPVPDPNAQIRLNKFMANSGICSRREADEYIKQGLVKVNGKVVTELGTKISPVDNVEFDEKLLAIENKTYILLNKPKDCVTTSDDPQGRLTVMDLVKGACNERIYPVGRLDRNTTGVLLLTNDGDLASKLTHPKFVKKKIYHVWVDRDISQEDMQQIADGIELEDGEIHADAISYATTTDRNQAGIEIHSGRNRIVRRIFEKLGYHVTKLDRVYFAGLTKKNLPRGRWRYLTQQEVNQLKQGAFE